MKTFTCNGKEVPLSKSLPLKLRDWKRLEQQGLSPKQLELGRIEDIAKMLLYVLSKGNPEVTMDDIDELSLNDQSTINLIQAIGGKGEELDRPFSTPSTSSGGTTVGADQT